MQMMEKGCCSSRFFWQPVGDRSAWFVCVHYVLTHSLHLHSTEGLAEDHWMLLQKGGSGDQ